METIIISCKLSPLATTEACKVADNMQKKKKKKEWKGMKQVEDD